MRKTILANLTALAILIPSVVFSQSADITFAEATVKQTVQAEVSTGFEGEAKAINQVISRFFEAMESGNTDALKGTCVSDVLFQTHTQDQKGRHQIFDEKIDDMVQFVASAGSGANGFKVDVDFEMAQSEASTSVFRSPYYFYINGELSHCGVNSFEMTKTSEGWKIKKLIDTRFRACN